MAERLEERLIDLVLRDLRTPTINQLDHLKLKSHEARGLVRGHPPYTACAHTRCVPAATPYVRVQCPIKGDACGRGLCSSFPPDNHLTLK